MPSSDPTSNPTSAVPPSGALQDHEASELLQWARQERLTGAFHFAKGSARKSLYFDGGHIIASASSQPREQLGHFLVGRGSITEFELAKAIELQEETGLMIGAILVSIGSLTETALRELLVRQCTEIVYDLLTWTDGSYQFEDRGSLPRGLVPAEIDVGPVLLAGIKRLDEWIRIRDQIPSLRAIPVSLQDLDEGSHDPVTARILGLVNDRRSVEEIWLESHTTEFSLYTALVGAVERRELKFVVPPIGWIAEEPPEKTPRMVSVAELLDCAAVATEDGDRDLAERYLAAARSLSGSELDLQDPSDAEDLGDFSWFDQQPEPSPPSGRQAVPVLARPPKAFIRIDLTPQQSFLLSRIDGKTTVEDLLRISPIPEEEGDAAIAQLVEAGHIRL